MKMLRHSVAEHRRSLSDKNISYGRCLSILHWVTLAVWLALPFEVWMTRSIFPLAWIQIGWSAVQIVAILPIGFRYLELRAKIRLMDQLLAHAQRSDSKTGYAALTVRLDRLLEQDPIMEQTKV